MFASTTTPHRLVRRVATTSTGPNVKSRKLLCGKKSEKMIASTTAPPPLVRSVKNVTTTSTGPGFKVNALGLLLGTCLLLHPANHAGALDIETAQKTWKCLLGGCRSELVRCVRDPSCAANLVCLETCSPGDLNCQVRCGDIFQNKVVEEFNTCLLSKKKCIPQSANDGSYPVPPDCALVEKFNTQDFTGTWYITSGLNPLFDLYDCQVHEFSASPHKLTGKLTWRVTTPDGGFITRNAMQNFVQKNPKRPGVLSNHDNEYLNYKDDWFIVSARLNNQPDDYVFVYYNGSNDAWDGYGGAVVYTRSSSLPKSNFPELRLAAAKVGLDFDNFKMTDNSCGPQPSLFARVHKRLFEGERALATNRNSSS
ncbi:violaxanthin de-epoxidase, chloroplastic [Selaginella moellendorffii]|nr:violaxanthin de-epoxidase, chloroplastic [Selaginella moellendorffii]|eukprot:XP_002987036.2 violaxanthin de-epoxidase, chloroplastic [Selaginella moellendorffii]